MKVLIVGGVAGGASAAARLRRLNEDAEIILFERGGHVSYANCGLPYYIGGVITKKSALTVQTAEALRTRLNLDVRTNQEVTGIDPAAHTVRVYNSETDTHYTESYDKLVLAPGAEPVRPPFPGVEDERVFTLRSIPDTFRIHDYIGEKKPKRALVVGGGFIGLEMAENLMLTGLEVTVTEMAEHVIAPLDAEMAADVHHYIRSKGIQLLLGSGLVAIHPGEKELRVELTGGEVVVDMVLLSIGVRPETAIAKEAGLELGGRGAIRVDAHMRTSDKDIYAVGDAVEIVQPVTGLPGYVPLAGPANKQGRIAADNIVGLAHSYKGTQGSAIVKLFEMTIGTTGLNDAAATTAGLDFDKAYLMPGSHAGYYPGANPINMKVLFEKGSGRILGAQLVGFDGVDKRLDVLGVAIRHRLTANDLADLELAYAPPFSSAKDPVNMAGYVIQNLLEGQVKQYYAEDVPGMIEKGCTFVDVRSEREYAAGHIKGAINIPMDQLRQRAGELDKSKPVFICCQTGQRSYAASRILQGLGFTASHLAGGYRLYASAQLGQAPAFAPKK